MSFTLSAQSLNMIYKIQYKVVNIKPGCLPELNAYF